MKKKYQQPLVRVQSVEGEPLLNGGSIVNIDGKTQDTLGSDTTTGGQEGEKADAICVIFNPNPAEAKVTLPEGNWNIYINGEDAGTTKLGTATGEVTVGAISAMVLVQESSFNPTILIVGICAVAVALCAVAVALSKKKKAAK